MDNALTQLDWLARSVETAANFARTRPVDAVFAACDAYVLQAAARVIALRGGGCWSHLDVRDVLETLGANENRAVRAFAVETLGAFYHWLVRTGGVSEPAIALILCELSPSDEGSFRRVSRRRHVLPPASEEVRDGVGPLALRLTSERANVAA